MPTVSRRGRVRHIGIQYCEPDMDSFNTWTSWCIGRKANSHHALPWVLDVGECGPLHITVVSPSDSGKLSDAAYRYFFEAESENFTPPEPNGPSLLLIEHVPEQSLHVGYKSCSLS